MLLVTLITSIFVIITSKCVAAEFPRYRILAPQTVCPQDKYSPIVKLKNTVITIQTDADVDLHMNWTVRWHPLTAPSQRFTLLLWRTVRALETKLNGPQPEPLVFIIDDDELLYGVNYIFYVTAAANGETAEPKLFYINNTFGHQTLEVDGLTDTLSAIVVGGQVTFADIDYVLEAVVATCVPFHDYHFSWKVQSSQTQESLNISTIGTRLEIPQYSLRAGVRYDVTCHVIKDLSEDVIKQIELPFEVGYRGLEVYLSADKLIVGIDHGFTVESSVINHDYSSLPLTFHWRCTVNGMACELFEDVNEKNLIISTGFSAPGQYEIAVIVSVMQESSSAKILITVMDAILPIIQLQPVPRLLNEDTDVILVANASNLIPMCTLGWYFASEDQLNNTPVNDTCDECQHGTLIADAVMVYSLDENFLYDLIDFSNETEWREVTAAMRPLAGRARFVVECNCSLSLGCATEALVYADVHFRLNKGPTVGDVAVYPSSGTALETIFRVSSRPAADLDRPLRYSFYCSVGYNITLLLGSYLEHLAVETLLPYLAEGTEIWVEVCDIRAACSRSDRKIIYLQKGEDRSLDILMADISSYIKRCEMVALQRTAVAAVVTYTNAGQTEALAVFTMFLLDSVPTLAQRCASQYHEQYLEFLNKLILLGLDRSKLDS